MASPEGTHAGTVRGLVIRAIAAGELAGDVDAAMDDLAATLPPEWDTWVVATAPDVVDTVGATFRPR